MAQDQRAVLVRLKDTDLMVGSGEADVRGRTMVDNQGQEIGEIDGLLVDAQEHRVRLLQVGSGGFLGIGKKKQLVPVDAVTGVDDDQVRIDTDRDHVAGAPVYDPDLEEMPDLSVYEGVYGYYGHPPFWTPGYSYPRFPYYR